LRHHRDIAQAILVIQILETETLCLGLE